MMIAMPRGMRFFSSQLFMGYSSSANRKADARGINMDDATYKPWNKMNTETSKKANLATIGYSLGGVIVEKSFP